MSVRVSIVLVGGLLGGAIYSDDEQLVPVPPPERLEEAERLVGELFEEELADDSAGGRRALAAEFLKLAGETEDELAGRYVLFRKAADLASEVGDVDRALTALDMLQMRFAEIPSDWIDETLDTLTGRAKGSEQQRTLASYLVRLAEEAVVSDDLEAAERRIGLAEAAVHRDDGDPLSRQIADRAGEIRAFREWSGEVREALAALEDGSDDRDSKAIAGRYYCFQRLDWDEGLPLLKEGSDEALRELAGQELAASGDPGELLSLADAWYERGNESRAIGSRAMLARAHEYYLKAAPGLSGLNRAKALRRAEALEPNANTTGRYAAIWTHVRSSIAGARTNDLHPAGGFTGDKEYRDVSPTGGLLVGLKYTMKSVRDDLELVESVRPIYLPAEGEREGETHGTRGREASTLKAKQGYAVGTIRVRSGGGWEGFQLVYMKIGKAGLDPSDSYDSEWAGPVVPDRGAHTVGEGKMAVGIHGRYVRNADSVGSIGLIVVEDLPETP
jgi:hypothetical protein